MYKKIEASKAQILLGEKIESYRKNRGMSRLQLGKLVNQTEQQIGRYEAGAFVPMEMLDKIGKALDNRIEKRILRRISKFRDVEMEEGIDSHELAEFYEQAFPTLDEYY